MKLYVISYVTSRYVLVGYPSRHKSLLLPFGDISVNTTLGRTYALIFSFGKTHFLS